jgi:hypothetical protein
MFKNQLKLFIIILVYILADYFGNKIVETFLFKHVPQYMCRVAHNCVGYNEVHEKNFSENINGITENIPPAINDNARKRQHKLIRPSNRFTSCYGIRFSYHSRYTIDKINNS